MEMLLKIGKEKKVGQNIMVMLRSGALKLKKSIRDIEKQLKKQRDRAAKAASLVVSDLTIDKEVTKPLKASSDSQCNVQRYASLEVFEQALKKDEVNFKFPFIVSNGADNLDTLQKNLEQQNPQNRH